MGDPNPDTLRVSSIVDQVPQLILANVSLNQSRSKVQKFKRVKVDLQAPHCQSVRVAPLQTQREGDNAY